MPQEGTPGYLKYRVLNQNTGAVVIPDLPHLHQSSWTVRALQSGLPGSTSIGDFRIPLPAPGMEDHKRARYLYDLLLSGQKIEGYLGDVITGSPRFSGVITKLHKPLGQNWEITGADTLWWLQQSQVFPGWVLPTSTTYPHGNDVVGGFITTVETVWDDDFSGWNGIPHPNSSDYTVSGWSFTASDPNLGLPALTSTAISPTDASAVTTTTWPVGNQYTPAAVSIYGSLVAGTSTTSAAEVGVLLLADSTAQNDILVECSMAQTGVGTGLYNVAVNIYSRSAGTYTQQCGVANVFTNVGATFFFELKAVVFTNATQTTWTVKLFLNGKDTGCSYVTGTPPASGGVGLRCSAGTGGSPASYVNRLQFLSKPTGSNWGTSRFVRGTQANGANLIPEQVTSTGQTHLDIILMAAMFDGFQIRKTPGAGFKADTIDYGSPGTDLSASIVFEEGVNLQTDGTEVTSVADLLATDVDLHSVPGVDSAGIVKWGRLAATGDMVLHDSAYDVGITTFRLLLAYAKLIQARKVNPMQAIQVAAIRTASTADKWRELDSVQVHIPTLGVNHQKAQVVGYTFTEGDTKQTVYLNQLPAQETPQAGLQRLVRSLDWLTAIYQAR